MNSSPEELMRRLAKIQADLRSQLIQELRDNQEDLESIFDPYSFSPLVHELREKYLTRIYLLQGLIQQLAHSNLSRFKHATRVISVVAESQPKLVEQVNSRLCKLNGSKVLDVTFIPGNATQSWSALITYEVNPFLSEADSTAAWM